MAAKYSGSQNLLHARVTSVFFAALAVVLSTFNTVSYLLQVPFRFMLNITAFDSVHLVTDVIGGFTDAGRSFLFVSSGITFIIAGILFPAEVFAFFAPDYYDTVEARLEEKIDHLKKEIEQKEAEKQQHNTDLLARNTILQKLEEENEKLRKENEEFRQNRWFRWC